MRLDRRGGGEGRLWKCVFTSGERASASHKLALGDTHCHNLRNPVSGLLLLPPLNSHGNWSRLKLREKETLATFEGSILGYEILTTPKFQATVAAALRKIGFFTGETSSRNPLPAQPFPSDAHAGCPQGLAEIGGARTLRKRTGNPRQSGPVRTRSDADSWTRARALLFSGVAWLQLICVERF